MTDTVTTIGTVRVLQIAADGPTLGSEQDALDLLGATYGQEVEMIVVPASRLDDDFFRLRTGIAGAFIQKIRNYQYRLAIIGDISAHIAASTALRDFVYEGNRRKDVIFAPDLETFAAML